MIVSMSGRSFELLHLKNFFTVTGGWCFNANTTNMNSSADHTTNDLHQRYAALQEEHAALKRQYAELTAKLEWFEEQFRLAQNRRFSSSSERSHPDQMSLLFDEVEVSADLKVQEPTLETVTYERRKARKNRKDHFEELPVETKEYFLPEDEQICGVCDGSLHPMSTQVRRELKIIPAQVKVVEHVQHVYGCRTCEKQGTSTPIVTAPMPKPVIPKSLASASAIAYVLSQKFVDGLPLYRQEQHLARLGVALSRQTMANWVLNACEKHLVPLYERMRHYLLQRDILQADETPLQVLREPGRAAETQSTMWMYRTGRDGPPIVTFEYQSTRAGKHPETFLTGFSGYLQVDGYAGYDRLAPTVTLVGCWAHARRKFDEALKALPSSKRSSGPVAAQVGLDYCNRLYAIERALKGTSPQRRKDQRDKLSAPVLVEFKGWLDEQILQTLPKSTLGQAINYCLNQWDKLIAFLQDGRLDIDNNRSERSIKPFVIGRKNWLFANTPRGAKVSSIAYSMVETAKENGLKPFEYLTYLFERLPNIETDDPRALDALLPWSETLPDMCRMRPGA